MKPKNRVSKSLLLLNPAIIHQAPPHSNQASPSRIWASGMFPSPARVPAPSPDMQCQALPLGSCTAYVRLQIKVPKTALRFWEQTQELWDVPWDRFCLCPLVVHEPPTQYRTLRERRAAATTETLPLLASRVG